MNNSSLSPNTGRLLLAFACVATALPAGARAQATEAASAATDHAPVRLDRYVVSASRTPQDPKYTPSSVSVILPDELAAAQVPDLRTALAGEPGVALVSTGAKGAQTSIFMRGANPDQVLILVDGVRMNSADAPYSNFLGGADFVGLDRIEILRGPQSTLYGGSAMGGVIALETARGCGTPQGRLTAAAGSFDTLGGTAAIAGGTRTLGYSASLASSTTDNDRPDNRYRIASYSGRLEWLALPELLVGATLRGQKGDYDESGPEPLGFSSRGSVETPNHLVTAYARWSPGESFRSRLTAGWHQTEYSWTDKTYGPLSNYYYRNTRRILDWQNSWQAAPAVLLIAGANAEWSHYTVGGTTLKDDQQGVYLNADYRPFDALTATLGARTDDHDLEGRANTWRSGLSYRIAATGTKLRGTYGTGFKAPTMANRFGMPPWYAPSPAIKPEKSRGWDIGFDQEIASGALTASATYFHNQFDDLINNTFVLPLGRYVAGNVRKAVTEGVEVALSARPFSAVKLRASYTYLSARDTSDGSSILRLVRRPRHTGDFDAQWQAAKAWQVGAGVHFVADRLATSTAQVSLRQEDYTTARLYSSYAVTPRLTLKVRIENALDETYAEAAGYPALPRAFFGGAEWRF